MRGMSPLISGVLLLVFALVLGLIIISWAAQSQQKVASCQEVYIQWVTMNTEVVSCIRQGSLELALENTGRLDITGINVQLRSQGRIENREYLFYLPAGHAQIEILPLPEQPQSIKVVPVANGVACGQNGIILEKLDPCIS